MKRSRLVTRITVAVFLLFLSCGHDGESIPGTPRKIILSSDISVCLPAVHEVDDGYVLGYALGTPGVELLGLVASHGNTTSLNSYDCALKLTRLAERADIPVFRGSEGIPERWLVTDATRGMKEIVDAHPGEVWIVTTGAATDLASFIKNYPESASRAAGMLMMAGVVYGTEGYLKADIINVQKDPESADYVLKKATNLVIAPLDLTEDVVFPYELWQEATKAAKSPYSKYLLSQTEEWITLQKPVTGGFYPFDAVGLSGLLYPEIITRTEFLRLEEDLDRASPTWSRFLASADTSRPLAEVWLDLNEEEFMRSLRKALGI
ncbi:MAG: nucleoside hydrolase [Proteobacteria bacterium]|nr:nucleoside hydrolase [Pseudomonadota bacterium]